MKVIGMMMLLVGAASVASAAAVPEIDASTGVSAITLLSGALLVMRSRRGRK